MRNAILLVASCAVACSRSADQAPESDTRSAASAENRPAVPVPVGHTKAMDASSAPPTAPVANLSSESAATRAGPCTSKETVRITLIGKGPDLKLEPDPEHDKAVRQAEVDLDGQGGPDIYVVFPKDFGSDGAIVQALYVHCGEGRYAPVWGPEYALELHLLDTRFNGWREVKRREKSGGPEAPRTTWSLMRFQDSEYQDIH